jgi:hypothetical protein
MLKFMINRSVSTLSIRTGTLKRVVSNNGTKQYDDIYPKTSSSNVEGLASAISTEVSSQVPSAVSSQVSSQVPTAVSSAINSQLPTAVSTEVSSQLPSAVSAEVTRQLSSAIATALANNIVRNTKANFTSNNPTLAAGQIGLETDTNLIKIGNGSTAWNSLSYINSPLQVQSGNTTTQKNLVIETVT